MIALIPGHGQKAAGYDPGAVAGQLEEARLVRTLCARIVEVAGDGRAQVFEGPRYTDRRVAGHRWLAERGGRGVVLHVHCNAGGGSYGLILHDPRSRLGGATAASLGSALSLAVPPGPRSADGITAWRCDAAIRPTWSRGANLLEPTFHAPMGVAAVLLEWAFIDNPAHVDLMTTPAGIDRTARAVVSGLLES